MRIPVASAATSARRMSLPRRPRRGIGRTPATAPWRSVSARSVRADAMSTPPTTGRACSALARLSCRKVAPLTHVLSPQESASDGTSAAREFLALIRKKVRTSRGREITEERAPYPNPTDSSTAAEFLATRITSVVLSHSSEERRRRRGSSPRRDQSGGARHLRPQRTKRHDVDGASTTMGGRRPPEQLGAILFDSRVPIVSGLTTTHISSHSPF